MATTTSLPVDLRGLVDDILVSKDTLGAAAAELRHLAGQTQRSSFGLVLEVVLPLLASSQTTESKRLVGLFAISSLYADYPLHLDPFRETYEAALVRTKWSLRPESAALNAAVLYILCGLGHLLSAFTISDLVPFSLPVGEAFPLGASAPVVAVDAADDTPVGAPALDQVVRCLGKAVRVPLNSTEQRTALVALPDIGRLIPGIFLPSDLPALIRRNADVALAALRALFDVAPSLPEVVDLRAYAAALADMDLTLSGLDLLTRLLCAKGHDSGSSPDLLRSLVKLEALGIYTSRFIGHVDALTGSDDEGDALPRLVRIMSLFAAALLDADVLRPGEDVAMELAGFALRHSRFADAQRLYARLIAATATAASTDL